MTLLKNEIHLPQMSLNPRRIRFEEHPKDLAEFLYKLFIRRDATFYIRGSHQCHPQRARSVEDAYKGAKTYFPELTLERVSRAVQALINKNLLNRYYCFTVRKQVHSLGNATITHDDVERALKNSKIRNWKAKEIKI